MELCSMQGFDRANLGMDVGETPTLLEVGWQKWNWEQGKWENGVRVQILTK
jgi:hypothetical protein